MIIERTSHSNKHMANKLIIKPVIGSKSKENRKLNIIGESKGISGITLNSLGNIYSNTTIFDDKMIEYFVNSKDFIKYSKYQRLLEKLETNNFENTLQVFKTEIVMNIKYFVDCILYSTLINYKNTDLIIELVDLLPQKDEIISELNKIYFIRAYPRSQYFYKKACLHGWMDQNGIVNKTCVKLKQREIDDIRKDIISSGIDSIREEPDYLSKYFILIIMHGSSKDFRYIYMNNYSYIRSNVDKFLEHIIVFNRLDFQEILISDTSLNIEQELTKCSKYSELCEKYHRTEIYEWIMEHNASMKNNMNCLTGKYTEFIQNIGFDYLSAGDIFRISCKSRFLPLIMWMKDKFDLNLNESLLELIQTDSYDLFDMLFSSDQLCKSSIEKLIKEAYEHHSYNILRILLSKGYKNYLVEIINSNFECFYTCIAKPLKEKWFEVIEATKIDKLDLVSYAIPNSYYYFFFEESKIEFDSFHIRRLILVACRKGNIQLLRYSKKIVKNFNFSGISQFDINENTTPLMEAKNSVKVIKFLIYEADVIFNNNIMSKYNLFKTFNIVKYALKSNNKEMMLLLINHPKFDFKSLIKIEKYLKVTIVFAALAYGWLDVVEVLWGKEGAFMYLWEYSHLKKKHFYGFKYLKNVKRRFIKHE